MSNYQEQFAAIFERAAQDKTFSFEAIKQINEMRTMFDALQLEKTKLELELKSTKDAFSSSVNSVNNLLSKVSELEGLVAKKEELSRKEFELKIRGEADQKALSVALDMFRTVFANVTTRRSVNGMVPVGVPNGGYQSTYSKSETEEISEV